MNEYARLVCKALGGDIGMESIERYNDGYGLYLNDLAGSVDHVNIWVKGWLRDAALGRHIGVRRIAEAAENIKAHYCTNGFWTEMIPAKDSYDALIRYAELAQKEFEEYLNGNEDSNYE